MAERIGKRAMFGFLKKHSQAKAAEKAELEQADKMGRDASQAMLADIDQFIEKRAIPVGDSLLEVFRIRINDIDPATQDSSPIDVARAEGKIFIEEVDRFEEQMRYECRVFMAEWQDLFDQMDLGPLVPNAIDQKLLDFKVGLVVQAAQLGAPVVEAFQHAGYKGEIFPG